MSRTYTIRDLTRELGVTARTLRHYEAEGLIAPRREGQHRLYSARDRARITLVLRGRRVGFSLAEIREILDLYELEGSQAQLAHARRKLVARVESLERQRADLEEALDELRLGLTKIDYQLAEFEPEAAPRVRLTGYSVMPMEDER